MTLTHTRLNELAAEITEWGSRQGWTFFGPRIGVLEEVGEIAHCILKNKQRIRGFEDEAFFKDKLGDGIADATVYLLNDMGRRDTKFVHLDDLNVDYDDVFDPNDQEAVESALGDLSDSVSSLLKDFNSHDCEQIHVNIMRKLTAIAVSYGLNHAYELEKTWAKVSKRDWSADRVNAAEKAETLGNEKPSPLTIKL